MLVLLSLTVKGAGFVSTCSRKHSMISGSAGRLLVAFAFLLLPSISALAQGPTTGRIAGTVTDPKGAIIVGAAITASSNTTGAERKVTTDSDGNYTAPFLPPGAYRIRVTTNGFAPSVFDVQVVITQTTTINVELEVAGVIFDPVIVP